MSMASPAAPNGERLADRLAREIASMANECCGRSDGYEEAVRDKARVAIRAALDEAAKVAREGSSRLPITDTAFPGDEYRLAHRAEEARFIAAAIEALK